MLTPLAIGIPVTPPHDATAASHHPTGSHAAVGAPPLAATAASHHPTGSHAAVGVPVESSPSASEYTYFSMAAIKHNIVQNNKLFFIKNNNSLTPFDNLITQLKLNMNSSIEIEIEEFKQTVINKMIEICTDDINSAYVASSLKEARYIIISVDNPSVGLTLDNIRTFATLKIKDSINEYAEWLYIDLICSSRKEIRGSKQRGFGGSDIINYLKRVIYLRQKSLSRKLIGIYLESTENNVDKYKGRNFDW